MNNVFKLPKGKAIEMVEMYDLKVRFTIREGKSAIHVCCWATDAVTTTPQRCTCVHARDTQGSLHTRYVGPEEQAMGRVSVLKDLNFCNRHEGTDRSVHCLLPLPVNMGGACPWCRTAVVRIMHGPT